jgi:hypothetical protein
MQFSKVSAVPEIKAVPAVHASITVTLDPQEASRVASLLGRQRFARYTSAEVVLYKELKRFAEANGVIYTKSIGYVANPNDVPTRHLKSLTHILERADHECALACGAGLYLNLSLLTG